MLHSSGYNRYGICLLQSASGRCCSIFFGKSQFLLKHWSLDSHQRKVGIFKDNAFKCLVYNNSHGSGKTSVIEKEHRRLHGS